MNMFSKILHAREKQAELCVHAHLATFNDATLSSMGYKRKDLKKGGHVNFFM